jgi:DNA topoisomerase-2
MWVFDDAQNRISLRNIEYVPGLYKLFDEGIVNCRDHVIRMIQNSNPTKKNVTYIDTQITEDGVISFENDGNGVDVVKHPEYDLWIPEMIFANLHQLRQDREENRRRENVRVQTRAHLVGVRVNRDDRPRQGLKYTQSFNRNRDF